MRKVCIYFFFTSACSIFWKMCVWRYRLRPLPCPRAQNRRAVTALGQGPKDWMNLFCCPEGATLSSIGFSRKLGSDSRQQWAEDQIRCFVFIARATFAFVLLFCVFLWQHCGATYRPGIRTAACWVISCGQTRFHETMPCGRGRKWNISMFFQTTSQVFEVILRLFFRFMH